jgi:hypothetical protein
MFPEQDIPRLLFTVGYLTVRINHNCNVMTLEDALPYFERALTFNESVYGGGHRAMAKYQFAFCLLEQFYRTKSPSLLERVRNYAVEVIEYYKDANSKLEYVNHAKIIQAAEVLIELTIRPPRRWPYAFKFLYLS